MPGSLQPLFSLRLQELGFTPLQMSWVWATQALAALAAPLIGQVADRWWPAERCLAVLFAAASALLWLLGELTDPAAVFVVCLAFWTCAAPAMSLATVVSLAHLRDPERTFGQVRLWGTVGWMVPGWLLLGRWWLAPGGREPDLLRGGFEVADTFRLASVLAGTLAAYALTLPHTPPERRAGAALAPLAALRLLRRRAFAVQFACTLGVCVTFPFSTQVTPLLLEHLEVSRPWVSPTLSIAQGVEVACLALLPALLLRLGQRGTMLLGLAAWAVSLAVFSLGRPAGLVVGSLSLHGLFVCCYLVAGQVFVNSQVSRDARASAQALLTFTGGLGQLIGHLLVGWVRRLSEGDFPTTYAVGAGIATVLVATFFVGFSEDAAAARRPAADG